MARKNIITALGLLFACEAHADLQWEVDNQAAVYLNGQTITQVTPLVIRKFNTAIYGPGVILGQIIIAAPAHEVFLRDLIVYSGAQHGIVIDGVNGVWLSGVDIIGEQGASTWCIRVQNQDSMWIRDVECQMHDNGLWLGDGLNVWSSGLVLDKLATYGILAKPATKQGRINMQFVNTWISRAKHGVVLSGRHGMVYKARFRNTLGVHVGRLFRVLGDVRKETLD